ncbi:MAG: glycerol-3-phosphate 1-O-acyltransferase PlsY [candidate division WOR-3 bacterium]|nr:glycerol-3-phosphate 1-O-acyltransferase PlsY [candidate division WOR-3 bacterium]MCX7947492.1 glycerol-3-phosphate 1-O-acyltransferase PlsY [candidate division WOR-3 bacterium]MDW8150651.1 glycerol-3-phosphate 1-O-acyltransferase PlsY [candidate division WOR-3 bacterium]
MNFFISAFFSYVLGSIPFGYIISKLKGIDITKLGSGNIGATNVGRYLGKKYFFIVLFLDALKGFVPAMIFKTLYGIEHGVVAGLFAVLGHSFSIFMKFKGGKGVATGLGISLALIPIETLLGFLVWFLVLYITKIMAIASIISAISVFALVLLLQKSLLIKIVAGILAILIVIRHRSNIERIMKGQEPKFYFFERR